VDDVPWNMPGNAYGVFEPEGLCIWVNAETQDDLDAHIGVLSHEFMHYVHSLSTLHSIDNLLTLLFQVHAGIQRLEDAGVPPSLPLADWPEIETCPEEVRRYVRMVERRRSGIHKSLGAKLDMAAPDDVSVGELYREDGRVFIKATDDVGAPVGRLTLMEGAALAKKCEAVGNDADLTQKKKNGGLSHYFAAYEACRRANPRIDPLAASALLCDIALCAPREEIVFGHGLTALATLPQSAGLPDFADQLVRLYDQHCRRAMDAVFKRVEEAYSLVSEDHKSAEKPSWGDLAIRNCISALRVRQGDPLALIRPRYVGWELFDLASLIGSPVIVTNDMRLTSLVRTAAGTDRARTAVRLMSYICEWVLYESDALRCPYAGCPGCPPARLGGHCATNAAKALLPADDQPWCALLAAAHQLRVADLLRSAVNRAA
jgi:hypothetical protein